MTTGKVGATLIVVPPSIFSFIVTTSKVSCFTVPTLLCVTLTPFSFPIFIAKLESFASIFLGDVMSYPNVLSLRTPPVFDVPTKLSVVNVLLV